MSFGKIHHWLMMGAMIAFASAWALATYGASTNVLHIALGYAKHITVDAIKAAPAAIKGIGVAIGNVLSIFGIDPGWLTQVDPSTMADAASHGHGAHHAMQPPPPSAPAPSAPPPTATPPAPTGAEHANHSMTGAEGGALKKKFATIADWVKSQPEALQTKFAAKAKTLGMTLEDYASGICDPSEILSPVPSTP